MAISFLFFSLLFFLYTTRILSFSQLVVVCLERILFVSCNLRKIPVSSDTEPEEDEQPSAVTSPAAVNPIPNPLTFSAFCSEFSLTLLDQYGTYSSSPVF